MDLALTVAPPRAAARTAWIVAQLVLLCAAVASLETGGDGLVETVAACGVTFVALGFGVIPDVRLPVMVEQIRRGIAWLYANIARFGGDPDRIHLSGHSSGGHLAAVLLTTDWPKFGLPADVLKSGLCISGMYDLHPVMLSARSRSMEAPRRSSPRWTCRRKQETCC